MNTVDAVASSTVAYRYIPFYTHIILYYTYTGNRDSLVGIATRYGLDGPGIESRGGRDFPYLSVPALKPTQPPMQWVPSLYRG
jgi:hypothetical protein